MYNVTQVCPTYRNQEPQVRRPSQTKPGLDLDL